MALSPRALRFLKERAARTGLNIIKTNRECHSGLAAQVGVKIAKIVIKVGLPEPHSGRGEGQIRCGNRKVFR